MSGLVTRTNRQVYRQPFLPTRKGSVIRRAQRQTHQPQQRLDKALGLPQGQAEQLAKSQCGFNGQIRIQELRSTLSRSRIAPSIHRLFAQPHGQATTLNQGLVIGRPVFDSINRLFLRNTTALVRRTTRRYFFHQRLLEDERRVFLPENPSQILPESLFYFKRSGQNKVFVHQNHSCSPF